MSIWSTPKSAINEARKIRRVIDNCSAHKAELEGVKAAEDEGDDGI